MNKLVWDSGCTQVVENPMRGDSLLDVHLVRPEGALTSCERVQGINDHCRVLLEWVVNGCVTKGKRLVSAYHKTDVVGLQNFLRDKLPKWESNGSCVRYMEESQGHNF
jgi:hypothetical protein